MDSRRQAVVDTAREYIGVRWRHLGRTHTGIDCVGLVILAGRAAGCFDPKFDYLGYSRTPDGNLLPELRRHLHEIPIHAAKSADILVYRDTARPCHVGIRAEKRRVPTLIHAKMIARKVVEQPLDQVLEAEGLRAAFSFPGVDDG